MRQGDLLHVDIGADVVGMLGGGKPAAKLTSKAKRFTVQLGARGDQLSLRAAVETTAAKDARQIAAVVNGLKALLSLTEPGDDVPQFVYDAFMEAQARADGATVTLEFDLPKGLIDEAMREVRRELGGEDDDERREREPRAERGRGRGRAIR
jgi:hypothetical protein